MPASSPTLVTGNGASGTASIGGVALGCIVGDLSDDGQRNMQAYQTLCDDVAGYEQATPGALTRNLSATVEFLAGGAGIAAAEAALKSGAKTTFTRVFSGQTSGEDSETYDGFVTGVRKSISAGAATGQVQVNFRAIGETA